MADAKRVLDIPHSVLNKPRVSKTVGGYIASFDGYRINLPDGLLEKIYESVEKGTNRDSYWLGHLLARVKPRLKRAECRLCEKHIKKEDAQPENPNSYMPYPFHKKCYETVRKKEASDRFIKDAAKYEEKKSVEGDEMIKIFKGLAKDV